MMPYKKHLFLILGYWKSLGQISDKIFYLSTETSLFVSFFLFVCVWISVSSERFV